MKGKYPFKRGEEGQPLTFEFWLRLKGAKHPKHLNVAAWDQIFFLYNAYRFLKKKGDSMSGGEK